MRWATELLMMLLSYGIMLFLLALMALSAVGLQTPEPQL